MDKAGQGTGGAVINIIAYKTDYVRAGEELKVLEATARSKNCPPKQRTIGSLAHVPEVGTGFPNRTCAKSRLERITINPIVMRSR